MEQSRKSLFGPFNPVIDELGHVLLTIVIVGIALLLGLKLEYAFIAFLSGLLIDVDHFLNTFICVKLLHVKNYKGGIFRGDQGYTPKIFHGIDVAFVIGILVWVYVNPLFGATIFLVLVFHELWDFIVYSHKANELLLITRAFHHFCPGRREYWNGLIFDENTLRW